MIIRRLVGEAQPLRQANDCGEVKNVDELRRVTPDRRPPTPGRRSGTVIAARSSRVGGRGARSGKAFSERGTTVLIADPLSMFRVGVRAVVENSALFAVVEARTLDEAIEAVEPEGAAIALIDLRLPPLGGIEAAAQLSRRAETRAVVWSSAPTPENVLAALRNGAAGYLDKRIAPPELIQSLRSIAAGQVPLSRDVVGVPTGAPDSSRELGGQGADLLTLSVREHEVLEHVATGSRNREIADELGISEFTVKRHVQNVLRKLGVPSRSAAASFYRSHVSSGSLRIALEGRT